MFVFNPRTEDSSHEMHMYFPFFWMVDGFWVVVFGFSERAVIMGIVNSIELFQK